MRSELRVLAALTAATLVALAGAAGGRTAADEGCIDPIEQGFRACPDLVLVRSPTSPVEEEGELVIVVRVENRGDGPSPADARCCLLAGLGGRGRRGSSARGARSGRGLDGGDDPPRDSGRPARHDRRLHPRRRSRSDDRRARLRQQRPPRPGGDPRGRAPRAGPRGLRPVAPARRHGSRRDHRHGDEHRDGRGPRDESHGDRQRLEEASSPWTRWGPGETSRCRWSCRFRAARAARPRRSP